MVFLQSFQMPSWMHVVADYHDRYLEFEDYDIPFSFEDLISLILECQEGFKNQCVECGIDMGDQTNRQLCGKYHCDNSIFFVEMFIKR